MLLSSATDRFGARVGLYFGPITCCRGRQHVLNLSASFGTCAQIHRFRCPIEEASDSSVVYEFW